MSVKSAFNQALTELRSAHNGYRKTLKSTKNIMVQERARGASRALERALRVLERYRERMVSQAIQEANCLRHDYADSVGLFLTEGFEYKIVFDSDRADSGPQLWVQPVARAVRNLSMDSFRLGRRRFVGIKRRGTAWHYLAGEVESCRCEITASDGERIRCRLLRKSLLKGGTNGNPVS